MSSSVGKTTQRIDVPPESLGKEKSIWEHYNEMAAVDDNIWEVEWRDLADTVLVFVCMCTLDDIWLLIWFQDGLFAAFLSAFLVFLIPKLEPNSTDVAMDILIHISQQLSNSTTPAFVPTAFQASSNAIAVNMVFFLSLAFVLVDAFLAMLVKGWLQEFDRGWRKYNVAHLRAQERERRLQEFDSWKLHELVALLPILIQGSLLLFSVGMLLLIFPLHLPSAILCSCVLVFVVGFYGFTTYKSIRNTYAPFSSSVSRLLAQGLETLRTWRALITQRLASTARFFRPSHSSQGHQSDTGASHETTQSLPSDHGLVKPMQPHKLDAAEKSKVAPRSRSDINPQTHADVLERLLSTTAEAVENIPIFLALLDQPVKDPTLRPYSVRKWKELLHITLRLLKDPPTLPVSFAWTLARTTMICYSRKTADRQLCLTLQRHLGSLKAADQNPRIPLNRLFSSYWSFWLDQSKLADLLQTVAFLQPSDDADAELLWMVNTFHRIMKSGGGVHAHLNFFVAVLTYVSSTEQSRRSQVPLTAAAISAMHTIRSALDRGDIGSISGLLILPGTDVTSHSVSMTFCPVANTDSLDLWGKDCVQFARNLLQWEWGQYWHHAIQLSLISALYIDSTKRTHARPTFAALLACTKITDIQSQNQGAYDHDKLAVYWYMAVSQKPLDQDRDPIAIPYDVIHKVITEHSTLQLRGLQILEIAVRYVHKTAPRSSDWLNRVPSGLRIIFPDKQYKPLLKEVDYWVLLHLDTLLAPEPYLFPEEAKKLERPDTPAKDHIANARLELYNSLANADHEGGEGHKPDPGLLRVFLWSDDYEVCTQAFKWCVELAPISRSGSPEVGDGTEVFIPATIPPRWVEHFFRVLCKDGHVGGVRSWGFLESLLYPKWPDLPSPWRFDFAFAFVFSIVHPRGMQRLPAYQCLANAIGSKPINQPTYLPFLETMLQLVETKLTLSMIRSLEDWLDNIPEILENQDARAGLERILATRRQQPADETLEVLPSP